ncbi:MAG: translation initiation factor [Flavobacteriales bacterium]|tara:strand:- start:24865 stop:25188 length:324 start_codon:yes stop_codon:yes gene_type:complete
MDLQDQLKNFFPDHKLTDTNYSTDDVKQPQDEPIICKYEKRKGKLITILENFKINNSELKIIAKDLKKSLSVGGTVKENYIIIQGDYRDKIMKILNSKGFETKRVGG